MRALFPKGDPGPGNVMTGAVPAIISPGRPSLRPRDRNDERETGKERTCLRHEDSLSTYEFAEESDGTQRLFDFIDLLLTNDRGAVFVVDEINRSLHPMLSKHLVVVTLPLSLKGATVRGDSNTRRPVLLGSGNM